MEHKLIIRTEMLKLHAVCITWGTAAINVNAREVWQVSPSLYTYNHTNCNAASQVLEMPLCSSGKL